MARAKAIAPDGPAEFKIVKLFQISGRSPIFKIAHTTNGSNRSFIITTKETDFVGIIEWHLFLKLPTLQMVVIEAL